jgi:hypothetical protein
MPPFGAAQVQAMLRRVGVPVTLGAAETRALFDVDDEERDVGNAGGGFMSRLVKLTIEKDSLPGLAVESQLVADGITLVVRAIRRLEDGQLLELQCVERV